MAYAVEASASTAKPRKKGSAGSNTSSKKERSLQGDCQRSRESLADSPITNQQEDSRAKDNAGLRAGRRTPRYP